MVLEGKVLTYYKSEDTSAAPQGTISLDGSSVTALLDNNEFSSSTGQRTALFGITPTNSSRMYVIQATSLAEREAWMQSCVHAGAFQISVTPLSARTHHDSVIEGWVDRVP